MKRFMYWHRQWLWDHPEVLWYARAVLIAVAAFAFLVFLFYVPSFFLLIKRWITTGTLYPSP